MLKKENLSLKEFHRLEINTKRFSSPSKKKGKSMLANNQNDDHTLV